MMNELTMQILLVASYSITLLLFRDISREHTNLICCCETKPFPLGSTFTFLLFREGANSVKQRLEKLKVNTLDQSQLLLNACYFLKCVYITLKRKSQYLLETLMRDRKITNNGRLVVLNNHFKNISFRTIRYLLTNRTKLLELFHTYGSCRDQF